MSRVRNTIFKISLFAFAMISELTLAVSSEHLAKVLANTPHDVQDLTLYLALSGSGLFAITAAGFILWAERGR